MITFEVTPEDAASRVPGALGRADGTIVAIELTRGTVQ
jgi:hypothetical protein